MLCVTLKMDSVPVSSGRIKDLVALGSKPSHCLLCQVYGYLALFTMVVHNDLRKL